MLTVLHISSGDLWAGAEVMVFNLLTELKKNNDIHIVALTLNEGTLSNRLREVGVETYVLPETSLTFPRIVLSAFKLMKNKNIKIIHAHRYKENILALILSKLLRVQCLVSTVHGMPETFSINSVEKNGFNWATKINYFVLKKFFKHVVAVSKEIKGLLITKLNFKQKNVQVIYNGIPEIPILVKTNESVDRLSFQIGTVGRLVPIKNLDLLIEIAAAVKNKIKNVKISILGDGPLREKLIQKINDLKIADIVELVPPRENPVSYYQSLDLYMNTSLHEGIPLSILEAMMCKLPVIAPKVGGIPEIIENDHNGVLIENHKSNEYAKACINLYLDKNKRLNMGNQARYRILSNFLVSQMSKSYADLYRNSM